MDIDWERELDRAIARGGERPLSDYVVPGRRALRRRRTIAGVASAAAVAVVVGVGASLGGAAGLVGGGATGAGFAVDAGPESESEPDPGPDTGPDTGGDDLVGTLSAACAPRDVEEVATLDGAGQLCLAPGATIVERVPNPMDYPRGRGRSVGLEVEWQGSSTFVLATWRRGGSTSVSRPAVGDLESWLETVVVGQRVLDGDGTPVEPPGQEPLTLEEDGTLVAGPGITVVDQQDVDLGERFAAPGDPAVAVQLEVDGERAYAVVRRVGGTTDVVYGSPAFFDLDAFVADARERYSSNEGLR